jgi:hypothetical protein
MQKAEYLPVKKAISYPSSDGPCEHSADVYLFVDCFRDLDQVSHPLLQCETTWQELNKDCSCCHFAASELCRK